MKEISLSQGKFAIVDDEDYEELSKYKWQVKKGWHTLYATRNIRTAIEHTNLLMHRAIMGDIKGVAYDHIDGNGLNNQRENLRLATKRENAQNRGFQKNSTSEHKGVSWDKINKKWRVNICRDGKCINIGRYTGMIEAARAYDRKAKEFFGEFARLNFTEEGSHG